MQIRPTVRSLSPAALTLGVCLVSVPVLADVMYDPPSEPPLEVLESPFLLRHTGVRATVTGPVARVVVTQQWENPNRVTVDGLYIFPLPDNAAVTDMSLVIGDRRILGEVRRREEARSLYEQARAEGRVAGLLDQERPNVFSQRVANIMPGVRISVVIEFDQEIGCDDGACDYTFPTVVGPRFVPARQADPGAIDPPVVRPGGDTGQRLSVSVAIDAGVTLRDLRSPSHRVTVSREGHGRARVDLAEAEVARLDRDFRLSWRLGGAAPEVGLIAWRDPDLNDLPGAFGLIIQPPAGDLGPLRDEDASPREIVFVIDCSGSMSGIPLGAAKSVVRRALGALRPRDTFQIIRFSDRASGLGPGPLTADPGHVRAALAYLDGLTGEGGTEMIAGIRAALDRPADPDRLRIVAFLTDGYIGNEGEILAEVRRLIGDARLFSFGIGSAVNRYLLEGLAEEGRGVAAFLGPREQPDEMVDRFVGRIATPVLTDIRIIWEDVEVEDLEPAANPDLFAGRPLVIHGRYRRPGTGIVVVEGRRGGRPVTYRRVVILRDQAADNEALGRLWARARIHRLSREMHDGARPEVREAIATLGLQYHLVTPFTSLVAVDSIVSNTSGSSRPVGIPVEFPEDVSYEGIFGSGREIKTMRPASSAPHLLMRSEAALAPASKAQAPGTAPGVTPAEPLPDRPGSEAARRGGFVRITLVEADGTRLVIEEAGNVWQLARRSRRLVRALTAAQLRALDHVLASTRPGSWAEGSRPGPHLISEFSGSTQSIALPSADPAVQELVRMMREFAFPARS